VRPFFASNACIPCPVDARLGSHGGARMSGGGGGGGGWGGGGGGGGGGVLRSP